MKESASLSQLQSALRELGVQDSPSTEPVDLDEFKRIARRPSDAEQWLQMMPLASLLARCLGRMDLDGLETLQPGELNIGIRVFSQGIKTMLESRLNTLKDQRAKFRCLPSDDSKFGGKLEGGNVKDFHNGLADRLGEFSTIVFGACRRRDDMVLCAGYPHPQIEKGMEDEHCEESLGCDVEFTTNNYNINTTPKKEYEIVKDPDQCPEEDKKDKDRKKIVRNVKRPSELAASSQAVQAKLMLFEVLAIVSRMSVS